MSKESKIVVLLRVPLDSPLWGDVGFSHLYVIKPIETYRKSHFFGSLDFLGVYMSSEDAIAAKEADMNAIIDAELANLVKDGLIAKTDDGRWVKVAS